MISAGRRRALSVALTLTSFGLADGLMRSVLAQSPQREIEMTARRFRFEPREIPLKAGERVVLLIRSIDFVHGFNAPDLGIRRDLMPGQVTRIELQVKVPGLVDFLCDNFCGDDHETMHGRFIVTA